MMAPLDLVLLFLFGGIPINAIIGDDRSIVGAVSVISTIGLMHIAVSWAKMRSGLVGRIVDGTPIIVYERGRWHDGRMQSLRLSKQDNHGGGQAARSGAPRAGSLRHFGTRWKDRDYRGELVSSLRRFPLGEKVQKFGGQLLGGFLRHVMAAVDSSSAETGRPGTPDAQHIPIKLLEIVPE